MSRFFTLLILSGISSILVAQENGAETMLASARKHFNISNYEMALNDLDSALSIYPEMSEAHYLKGIISFRKGDYQTSLEELSKAIEYNPRYVDAYYQRAIVYNLLEEHRNYTINDLNKAVSLDPENPKLYMKRAHYRATTQDPRTGLTEIAAAIADVSKAIRIDPDNAYYYRIRADYKFDLDLRLPAIADMDLAVDLNPSDPENFRSRGMMRLFIEDYRDAADDFSNAIRLDSTKESYYRNRAHAWFNLGRYMNSIDDYSESIRLITVEIRRGTLSNDRVESINKSLRNAYLVRGSAFIRIDRPGEGCEDFRRSRELGERKAYNYIRRYCN